MKLNTPEEEVMFKKIMDVFQEYMTDLDWDIEGCSAGELTEIEHNRDTAFELRRRIVLHLCEGTNARGL